MCEAKHKKKVNKHHPSRYSFAATSSSSTTTRETQFVLNRTPVRIMGVIWAVVLVIAATSRAAPAVKYDQRQEGDVNVRADLENFVVLIIPTSGQTSSSSAASSQGSSLGLFDLFSKAVPSGKKHHQQKKVLHQNPVDTAQFLESKTAPYHVDISKGKLHPEPKEVLIAESPTLAKSHREHDGPLLRLTGRRAKTVSIEVPPAAVAALNEPNKENEVKAIVVSPEEIAVGRVQLQVDLPKKNEPQETLMLLGEGIEQCGPGQRRDSNGLCQTAI